MTTVNAPTGTSRRWTLLVTVALGLLMITLDNSVLYTALPTLTEDLRASATQSLWIINAYPLVMAGLLLGAGTLGDRVGHRLMFLVGLVLFGAASVLAAFATSPEVLIAARAVLAVGAATMMPATLALIRLSFTDERERNLAIAVWGSVAVVGAALGPVLGGLLLRHFWWGSVFLVNVPVVLVALVATALVAPKGVADRSKQWDALSSLQVMVGLVGLVLVIKELAAATVSLPVLAVALPASAAGFWAFARRQRSLAHPLLDFALFRNPVFLAGVLSAGVAMFAMAGVQLVTTQRFQLVAGFSPLEAGLVVATAAAGSLVTGLLGGAFLHVVGLRVLIAGGLAVTAAGVLWTALALPAGLGWLIAGLVVAGLGMGGVMGVASSAIIGSAPAHRAGMASSVEEVSYEFGSLTAVALLGSLLTGVYSAVVDLPGDVPQAARESLTGAVTSANGDRAVLEPAFAAFDTGFTWVLLVAAGVLVAGAVATAVLLRGDRGRAGTISGH
ncbi:MFS transporter [Actinosynnema mirum]|uniref:Major facilitator superfamily MFS_1 n=1 Tax=Actinosynnema mirum (strain ATCC 29888 / DSM 43827 / JCM 3225 / NBRC 14064 / NCIMB 13271 / NRRL B-12336 / IMRU 3971 / 101) TaxID=446462 RepID=C6WGZ1_ACTMD|nr:MFS transporter [Actinosynnema mirum]ACU36059.1 major facilitator superfamily MFS_1 [Actinosynnema mirum DSM 43827]